MNDDPAFYRARAEEEQRNADNATLDNVRDRCRRAQLAWEAPMACGYGACYGCVVERCGRYVRLCVEGPILQDAA